ncbi:MAG: nucleotidyltransferase substrate binding protein [Caldisericia bacterium]
MGLNFSKIEDAISSLKEIIDYSKNKINEKELDILGKSLRSAVIHSFEYTYERTILTLRRWLDENYFRGKSAGTSKNGNTEVIT